MPDDIPARDIPVVIVGNVAVTEAPGFALRGLDTSLIAFVFDVLTTWSDGRYCP